MTDTVDLISELTSRLEAVLDALAPGWVRRGRRGYLAPQPNGNLGSWQIDVSGTDRGKWVRYSQASDRPGRNFMGGGPLGLVAYVLSGEATCQPDRSACDWARAFCGISARETDWRRGERIVAARRRDAERRERAEREAAAKRTRSRCRARAIWDAARPIAPGSLVHRYLSSRGIDLAAFGATPTLRLHPALSFFVPREPGGLHDRRYQEVHVGPAMVAAVQSPDHSLVGVHCTWLAPDGDGKAVIEDAGARLPSRKIFGEPSGGHVRFGSAGAQMVVGEGIESTLTVAAAVGVGAWAALSLANLRARLPANVREVILALDNDERDPALAERHKRIAIAAHAAAGANVHLLLPPLGSDWNDVAVNAARPAAGCPRLSATTEPAPTPS